MSSRARLRSVVFPTIFAIGALAACAKDSEQAAPVGSAVAPVCRPGTHAVGSACEPDAVAPVESASAVASASAAPSASAGPAPRCPDPANADRTLAFDWQKELAVDAPLAAKLRALAATAAETKALSVEIENELRAVCIRLATPLGAKGPFAAADVSCQAAADALRSARERLGAGAKVVVNVHPPICPEANADMEECSKTCSANEPSDPPKCIGTAVGRCPATCDGVCEPRGTSHCDAVCAGKCIGGFTGKCAGTCKGRCDGKDPQKDGSCAGKCEGSCEGTGTGECKGACDGGCQGKALSCPTGVCVGKCAAPVSDLACTGTLQPAKVGAECAAACTTRAVRKASCTQSSVAITVSGAKDAQAGATYETAIEVALPGLLRIERRLRGRTEAIAKNQKLVGDGLKDATRHGLAPSPSGCLIAVEKAVTEGVATLDADYRALSLVVGLAQAH